MRSQPGLRRLLAVFTTTAAFGLLAGSVEASPAAAAEAAWWHLSVSTRPSAARVGEEATVLVRAVNLGTASVKATRSPVTISDRLPAGLTVEPGLRGIAGVNLFSETEGLRGPVNCLEGPTVSCTWEGPEALQPFEELEMFIPVRVTGPISGVENLARISGGESYRCLAERGGAFGGPFCGEGEAVGGSGSHEAAFEGPVPPAGSTLPVSRSEGAPSFGLADTDLRPEEEGGSPDTQAGSHPFQLTTSVAFEESASLTAPPAFAKDLQVNLPPGLVGNAQGIAQCTEAQFSETFTEGGNSNLCPASSAVGVAAVNVTTKVSGFGVKPVTLAVPVFNLVPGPGEPARFGFEVEKAPVVIDTSVRTGAGYGVAARVSDITQFAVLRSGEITLWGTPGAAAHRLSRGWSCVEAGLFHERNELLQPCSGEGEPKPKAFLRMPTSCTGPLASSFEADSWPEPARVLGYEPGAFGHSAPALDGCDRLPFEPSLKVLPELQSADSPSGATVEVHLPQESTSSPEGIAESDLKDAIVTLPEGMVVDPASAQGLASCAPAQIELAGPDPPACPQASKIGTVEIDTPLIDHPLPGAVYLAAQEDNPFGSLLALYITVDDPISGVVVKLAGHVEPDPTTGRLTTVVSQSPQLPFEDLKLQLFGGSRAPLQSPPTCGTATTSALFTPWSGSAAVPSSSSFQVSSGANGAACATSEAGLPNHPSFEAGTRTPIAGAYSPFVLRLTRADGSQRLGSVATTLPAGLLGRLAGIPYCTEAEIAAAAARSRPGEGAAELAHPSCPAASQVGTVEVAAGAGPAPLQVEGKAYLAGPYKSAPLSLAIVTPAVAGPFDLGDVVVRTALQVDETTAQIRAVTDPLPTILDGIPLDIRSVAIEMNRPNFTINPTSCEPKQITGSATSTLGAVAPLMQRYQVGACGALGFKPQLKLSLKGSTRRAGVPALKAVLTYPKGNYSNIKSVSTVLPSSEFIDQAHIGNTCTRVQFNAGAGDGAQCPRNSILGHARAYSPLLEKPLEGTVYFRSNGGERELPDLVAALKGQINVTLVGFIDSVGKKGAEISRVRTRFASVPDAPVSRFVLQLAGAKKGLLQNSANLCKVKNIAQVKSTAQNGLTYDTEPTVANDCGKTQKKGKH